MRFALPLSALAAALALSACQSMPRTAQVPAATPAPVAAAAPAPAPAALPNDNLNATVWMQQTVEYAAVTQTVYRAAESRLDQALKDKTWNALVPEEREKPDASLPPAVIVDVDETVLDNSPYQARLVRSGGEYDEATWADWVHARKARAIPGAVAFAQAAAARGITVLYISNRATDLDADTLENLKAEGFPIKDASVFMGLGTFVPGCAAGRFRADHQQHPGRPRRAVQAVSRLVRGALVHAAQPDLRQLGTGAVQQRLDPARRRAPQGQAGCAANRLSRETRDTAGRSASSAPGDTRQAE